MSERVLVIQLDGVLGDTKPLWQAFLEHLERRFSTIEPLDLTSLATDRTEAAAQLDIWAASGVGDWRVQLTHFAENHLPVHLRLDAQATSAMRSLASAGIELTVVSDAPQELVDIAAAHLGLDRLAKRCTGGVPLSSTSDDGTLVTSAEKLDALLTDR